MMRLLTLSRHRRAKIWLDESPNAEYSPLGFVRRVISTGPATLPVLRVAAIELVVPRGPTANYGLLGAELIETGNHNGEVSIALNRTGFPLQGSLAVMPDDVHIGLLEEYAEAVVSGVEKVVDDGWRFVGELNFRWAAHASAGSSPVFFSDLGVLVTRLLASTKYPSEHDLVSLFS